MKTQTCVRCAAPLVHGEVAMCDSCLFRSPGLTPRKVLVIALLCLGFAAATFGLLMCAGCASMTPATVEDGAAALHGQGWTPAEKREAAILAAASAADIATTQAALKQPGVVEGNPIMRGSVGKQIAVNVASDALVVYLTHRLKLEGSPRWAWPSRVVVGLHLTAAGANLRFVW